MQSNDTPIENRFGEEVLESRRLQRLSQKDLAELLRQRGLVLDASAISRIEKGARAIRLSEAAVIADVLGFSLSDVEHPRDPMDDFARHRKSIDAGIEAAFHSSLEVAGDVIELGWLVERDPQVLQSVKDESGSSPTNITEYVKTLEAEWLRPTNIASTIGYNFESSELRDAVVSLIRTVTSFAVGEGTDGEHPETP